MRPESERESSVTGTLEIGDDERGIGKKRAQHVPLLSTEVNTFRVYLYTC